MHDSIRLAILGICAGLSMLPSCPAAAELDVTPGATGKGESKSWTRTGELGATPTHVNQRLPLSDQENENRWAIYLPLWDEFNSNSLDLEKWHAHHPTWKGRQPAWFSANNVEVVDGHLRLSMRKEAAPPELEAKGYKDYTSAAVHARNKVTYGYFEVRAQPMNSAGSSSFWFAGSNDGWRTEIDVFELGGKAKGFEQRYNMNLHVFHTPTEKKHWNVGAHWIAPWRLAEEFHVYGLEWGRDEIVYYVDGVPVRSVHNTHWHQPLYLIFDSETMPNWLGMPQDEDLPSTFQIDYIRSWKTDATTAARPAAPAPPAKR